MVARASATVLALFPLSSFSFQKILFCFYVSCVKVVGSLSEFRRRDDGRA
jgi:hypothetical protein